MESSRDSRPKAQLGDYLAAERTLLAWIRTGLALMGFGFVVARFGLFLQEFLAIEHLTAVAQFGVSLWFGVALIAAGVVVTVFSAWHHLRLVRGLDHGETALSWPTSAIVIALFLAAVGLAMTVYLISIRGTVR